MPQLMPLIQSIIGSMMLADLAFTVGLAFQGSLDPMREKDIQSPNHLPSGSISPLTVLGAVIAVIGALIRLWTYKAMGRQFTFKLALLKDHQLITSGPYAYVRHPGYGALIMTMVGLLCCELSAGSWWRETYVLDTIVGKGFAVLVSCAGIYLSMVFLRAPAEDRMLHENFGRQWEEWRTRVPYLFFPGIL